MKIIAVLLLTTAVAFAEDKVTCVQINGVTGQQFFECIQPDEATKMWALKRAYQLNGNSMVGPTIDLSRETPGANAVKTERVMPVVKTEDKNELDEAADLNMNDLREFSRRFNMKTDVCARYHMHKVTTPDGKSWHCRK